MVRTDYHFEKKYQKCMQLLGEDAQATEDFLRVPGLYLSRLSLGDRLYMILFLENLIATESGSELVVDYCMAVNEFLSRRSEMSIRMLGIWHAGKGFSSIQEAVAFYNQRYREAAMVWIQKRDELEPEFSSYRNTFERQCALILDTVTSSPTQIDPYVAEMDTDDYMDDPIATLQTCHEQERLGCLLLPEAVWYEILYGEAKSRPSRTEHLGRAINLINDYIKYPECPGSRDRLVRGLLRQHGQVPADVYATLADRLRMGVYFWKINFRGCRAAISSSWDEYGECLDHLPADSFEQQVPELYEDEAILNYPGLRESAVEVLREDVSFERCLHVVSMLEGVRLDPDNAVLTATILTQYIKSPSTETMLAAGQLFDWDLSDPEVLERQMSDHLGDLIAVWCYDYKDLRSRTKENWGQFEEAIARAMDVVAVSPALSPFAKLLQDPVFSRNCFSYLRTLEPDDRQLFLDLCAALNGKEPHEASTLAIAMATFLAEPTNTDAGRLVDRMTGWPSVGYEERMAKIREYLSDAALSWRYNFAGRRSDILRRWTQFQADVLQTHQQMVRDQYEQEFRSYEKILKDPAFTEDPCRRLSELTQEQCLRLLLFIGALSDLSAERAMDFATILRGLIFFPNDGIRERVDDLFGEVNDSDEDRLSMINEMLQSDVPGWIGEDRSRWNDVRERWSEYAQRFREAQEKDRKNNWALTEKNVHRLFMYCTMKHGMRQSVAAGEPGTVAVNLLGDETPKMYHFRNVIMKKKTLYSDQMVSILRYMLGQLEIVHRNASDPKKDAFYLDSVSLRRGDAIRPEPWTGSRNTLYELLYMAVGCELLDPIEEVENPQSEGEYELVVTISEKNAAKLRPVQFEN